MVGALALVGLSPPLAGARRTSRRGREARRGLRQSRRETAAVSQDRDDLLGQRETALALAASTPGNGSADVDRQPGGGRGAASGTCPGTDPLPRRRPPRPRKRRTELRVLGKPPVVSLPTQPPPNRAHGGCSA